MDTNPPKKSTLNNPINVATSQTLVCAFGSAPGGRSGSVMQLCYEWG